MDVNPIKVMLESKFYYWLKIKVLQRLFRSYATVLFCYSPWVGAWFALLTACTPRTAFVGFFSLICCRVWGGLLEIKPPGDLHLLNGLLFGLFISGFFPLTIHLIIAIIIMTLFITLSVNGLCALMWNLGKIPLMSLPFVLGTWLVIAIFHQMNLIALPALSFIKNDLPNFVSWSWTNDFFSALGGIFLIGYPLPGALIFLGLLIGSRYLALLSIAGYVIGAVMLHFFEFDFLLVPSGYNFILVALALGGIFFIPSRASFLIAMGGSALASLFVISLYKFLDSYHLPLLVLPFLLSSYFWLGGLGPRLFRTPGELNLDFPVSPEISWERVRLNKARGLEIENAFLPPFAEEWRTEVDAHSRHIYFVKSKKATSVDPVIYAPVAAMVLTVRDGEEILMMRGGEDSVSNPLLNAEVDTKWGNFVSMRDPLSQFIMIPYLKSGSIIPRPGQWVALGQPLATCAQMNDSEYQLDLKLHKGVRLTSENTTYYLINILVHQSNTPRQFYLFYRPVEGDYVAPAYKDPVLEKTLSLPATLSIQFNIKQDQSVPYSMKLETELTPFGHRLCASEESSAAYVHTSACLAFYDRRGKSNILLDMWILALGLTPLTSQADSWYDKPALNLWPLSFIQRLFIGIVRPLGVGCESRYSRTWNEVEKVWEQIAIHQANILPGVTWTARTKAIIDPAIGIRNISLEAFGHAWEASYLF